MQIFLCLITIIFMFAILIVMLFMTFTYSTEVKLKKVSEKISDGYVIFNKFGRVTNYNEIFLKYMNLKEADLKNRNIKELFLKSDLKKSDIAKILKNIDNIKNEKQFEITVSRKSKVFKCEFINLVDNDISMRYAVILKDISKDYKAIEGLKANEDMLANRERFATLRWINYRNNTFFKISDFCYNR